MCSSLRLDRSCHPTCHLATYNSQAACRDMLLICCRGAGCLLQPCSCEMRSKDAASQWHSDARQRLRIRSRSLSQHPTSSQNLGSHHHRPALVFGCRFGAEPGPPWPQLFESPAQSGSTPASPKHLLVRAHRSPRNAPPGLPKDRQTLPKVRMPPGYFTQLCSTLLHNTSKVGRSLRQAAGRHTN